MFQAKLKNVDAKTQQSASGLIEEERLQAISPEPEEVVIVEDEQNKQIFVNTQPQNPERQHNEQQEQQKIRRWNLVDGKFIPADSLGTTVEDKAGSGTASVVGRQIPKIGNTEPQKLPLPCVNQQQAQNILTQMAASTAALTARQILGESNRTKIVTIPSIDSVPTPSVGINIPPPPINKTLIQIMSTLPSTTEISKKINNCETILANTSTRPPLANSITTTTHLLGR